MRSLTAGDLAVAVPFTLSYGQLSPAARTTFRRLALVPGPHLGVAVTAVLAQCGLLQSTPVERYRFHDLLRLYAHARMAEEESPADRLAAGERMTGWLLDVAVVAGRWYEPDLGAPPPGRSDLVRLDTAETAGDWLRTESANWLAALRSAAAAGRHALGAATARAEARVPRSSAASPCLASGGRPGPAALRDVSSRRVRAGLRARG